MDSVNGKGKLKKLLGTSGAAFKAAASALGKICTSLADEAVSSAGRSLKVLTRGQKKPTLFVLAGFMLLLVIIVIGAVVLGSRNPRNEAAGERGSGPFIPMEELFIPAEPDFLPGFILEREPRTSWSLEDVRPYWRNPENTELWRGEIKSAVDKLMEAVP